jgi:hypothetical protein
MTTFTVPTAAGKDRPPRPARPARSARNARHARRARAARRTRLAPAGALGALAAVLVLVGLIQVFWFFLSPDVERAADQRPAVGIEDVRTPASLDVLAQQAR